MSSIKRRVDKLETQSFANFGFMTQQEKEDIAKALQDDIRTGGQGELLAPYPWEKIEMVFRELINEIDKIS